MVNGPAHYQLKENKNGEPNSSSGIQSVEFTSHYFEKGMNMFLLPNYLFEIMVPRIFEPILML